MATRRDAEKDRTATVTSDATRHPRVDFMWSQGGTTLRVPERGRAVVGRSLQADLVIDHPSLSRLHAALETGDGLTWSDLGSSNGTRVRGRRIAPDERVAVGWGEPVELGSVVAIVRPPADAALPSTGRAEPLATSIEQLERWIELVAATEMSVLLLGETGVGKGFFARRIHDRSARAGGPFLHINCAALPEHLLESELFGHERGAFTGAAVAKPGLLESASGGTIFLDEIGDVPLAVQAKVLVALERREVLRVGAREPRPFDTRFIAATNRALDQEVAAGRFRADLYYRLAGMPLAVPPLRERPAEIHQLATTLLAEAATRMRRPIPRLAPDALSALSAHRWPGNVRELMTVMERLVLTTSTPGATAPTVSAEAIRACLHPGGAGGAAALHPGGGAAAPSSPAHAVHPTAAMGSRASEEPVADEAEALRRRIVAALDRCAGNQSRAAEVLGISRRTLINRMDELQLPRPRKR